MDDSKNQAGNARLLNMPGRRDQMLRTMLLCALTAAIFFLPFYIIDGGFFHYAGDFNSQQISFYRYMNGFIKGAGYPDGMAGAARSTFSWATDLGSGAMNATHSTCTVRPSSGCPSSSPRTGCPTSWCRCWC